MQRIATNPNTLIVLKIVAAAIFITVALMFWVDDRDHGDDNLWHSATSANTIKSYQNYLVRSPNGQYRDVANKQIDRIRQDNALFTQAQAQGKLSAINAYLNSCFETDCVNRKEADQLIKESQSIKKDFIYHLEIRSLSIGENGHAMNDIERLAALFPHDPALNNWKEKVAAEYDVLAKAATARKDRDKAQTYLAKAKEIRQMMHQPPAPEAQDEPKQVVMTLDNTVVPPPTTPTPPATMPGLEVALASGDISFLQRYLKNCGGNCQYKEEVQDKLDKFSSLSSIFSDNLANNRLTAGDNNASTNIASLKALFPKSPRLPEWKQQVAEKFVTLAETEAAKGNVDKSSLYQQKAREFAANDIRLDGRRVNTLKSLFEAIDSGNVAHMKRYLSTCTAPCEYKDEIDEKMKAFSGLESKFERNVKNNRLTVGDDSAQSNLEDLKKLFPTSPLIARWSNRIADQFLALADKAREENKPKKMLKYNAKAVEFMSDERRIEHKKKEETSFNGFLKKATIRDLEGYIRNCDRSCVGLGTAQSKISDFNQLEQSFSENLNNNRLSISDQSAAADLAKLEQEFPNEVERANAWRLRIGKQYHKLAIEASLNGDEASIQTYQAKAREFGVVKEVALSPKKKREKEQVAKAIDEGDVLFLERYLNECQSFCFDKPEIESKLQSYYTLNSDFDRALKNDRILTGDKFAVSVLSELRALFPNSDLYKPWGQKIADRLFEFAAHEADNGNMNKAVEYRQKALQYGKPPANFLTKDQLNQAIEIGDVNKLRAYLDSCVHDCDVITTKIATFDTLAQQFADNLANDRLALVGNSAADNMEDLKRLFPKSPLVGRWSQDISGRLKTLALESDDMTTKAQLLDKAILYADADGKRALEQEARQIQQLARAEAKRLEEEAQQAAQRETEKRAEEAKRQKEQNQKNRYEQAVKAGTIAAAKSYIDACDTIKNCYQRQTLEQKLADVAVIQRSFDNNVKKKALTTGKDNAQNDVTRLSSLFPNDPLIEQWNEDIVDVYIVLANKHIKNNNANMAKKYVATARTVQDNKKLDDIDKKIADMNRLNSKKIARSSYPDMVYIPGKVFTVGGKFRNSRPARTIKIRPFKISRTEVTFKQFKKFARSKRIKLNTAGWGGGTRPVIYVSWKQAVAYTKWLSRKTGKKYSLPSEVQWEYVASNIKILDKNRNLSSRNICIYANGANEEIGSDNSWKNKNCRDSYSDKTAPVASFKPNGFGVFDMQGNVWEWTLDCWHKNYAGAPKKDKAWTYGSSCDKAVIRGGSYLSSTENMNPKYRFYGNKDSKFAYIGFRVVETI
jgi:formylglycine-generating enzyme required for sulfatase activity